MFEVLPLTEFIDCLPKRALA
jgi:hypothetical protein